MFFFKVLMTIIMWGLFMSLVFFGCVLYIKIKNKKK